MGQYSSRVADVREDRVHVTIIYGESISADKESEQKTSEYLRHETGKRYQKSHRKWKPM